jgi:hypothetical protein
MEVAFIMQRWLLLFALAIFASCGSAFAQYSRDKIDPTPYGFSFRGGAAFPVESELRDLNEAWVALGVDYTFTKQYLQNSETYLSVDYILHSTSGKNGTVWPLMVNQKFYTERDRTDNRTYFLAGVGAVVMDIGGSDTVIGARVGLGFELSKQVFAEFVFVWSDENDAGVRATNGAVYLGYRF